ncbi:MAG: hypothetical protein ABW170_01435 [Candidatus Thiodiazotropha sp. L084R]
MRELEKLTLQLFNPPHPFLFPEGEGTHKINNDVSPDHRHQEITSEQTVKLIFNEVSGTAVKQNKNP